MINLLEDNILFCIILQAIFIVLPARGQSRGRLKAVSRGNS